MDIEVAFETSAREQVRAARALIARQMSGWFLAAFFLGLPLALMAYLALVDPDASRSDWLLALGLLVGGGAWLYLFPWIPVLVVRRGQRGRNGPYTVVLSDTGVKMRGPYSTLEFRWEAVVKCVESPQFIFIYTGKAVAQAVPRRAFPPEALLQARELMERVLGPRARLRVEARSA